MKEPYQKESVRIQREMNNGRESKFDKYCELVVGRKGLGSFLKYEIIVWLCSRTTGAFGLWWRSKLYPMLLGSCGRNVIFGANVVLRHPNKIHIGDNVIVDDNCMLDAKGRDNLGIRIGSNSFIGRNSILSCKDGDIILEEDVNIGFNVEIFSGSNVTIGRKTLIAAYTYIIGGGHSSDDTCESIAEQTAVSKGILVEADCWIGAGSKLLDGITVGSHTMIGAGAVVTKNIPRYSIAVGVPAGVTGNRKDSGGGNSCD